LSKVFSVIFYKSILILKVYINYLSFDPLNAMNSPLLSMAL